MSQLSALEAILNEWLVEKAFPVWSTHGYDIARGGFYDALSQDSYQNTASYKRLRVLARQIYVFSEAARMGVPGARELVSAAVDLMLTRARHVEGGFCSRLSLDGEVIEDGRDLYDLAFVIFSLAHAWHVLRRSDLKEEAEKLYRFIEQELGHAAGGFLEGLPAKQPRRQNPHMHLLEACLAWSSFNESAWLDRASSLVELGLSRFIDTTSGALTEYFEDDWAQLPDVEGKLVEPGHQFEWVWLLAQYEKLKGTTIREIDGLYDFAWVHGVDPRSGYLHAEVTTDGTVRPGATRLWTYTEWLKAELAMYERSRDAKYAARAVMAGTALADFLKTPSPGLWWERRDPLAGFSSEPAPATSLYHITLALSELRRVKDLAPEA